MGSRNARVGSRNARESYAVNRVLTGHFSAEARAACQLRSSPRAINERKRATTAYGMHVAGGERIQLGQAGW